MELEEEEEEGEDEEEETPAQLAELATIRAQIAVLQHAWDIRKQEASYKAKPKKERDEEGRELRNLKAKLQPGYKRKRQKRAKAARLAERTAAQTRTAADILHGIGGST